MCTTQSQRRVFTSDAHDMTPSDFARYCGPNGFTRDEGDVPAVPPNGGTGLSAKDIAALKQLAAAAPALLALADGKAPAEKEMPEAEAMPSPGRGNAPTKTLDGGFVPLGWDIYTDSRHLQSVAADDAEWAD